MIFFINHKLLIKKWKTSSLKLWSMSKKSSLDHCWEISERNCTSQEPNSRVNLDQKTEWFQVWEISPSTISNPSYNKLISLHQMPPLSAMLRQVKSPPSGMEPLFWEMKASPLGTTAWFKIEFISPKMLALEIKSLSDQTQSCKEQTFKAEPLFQWAPLSSMPLSKREDLLLQVQLLRTTPSLRKERFGQAVQPNFWEPWLHWKDK